MLFLAERGDNKKIYSLFTAKTLVILCGKMYNNKQVYTRKRYIQKSFIHGVK